MPRAKTPPAETVSDLFLSDAEQRAKKVVAESQADGSPIFEDVVPLTTADILSKLPVMKYSPKDMEKLDQFAIGLLGPNTGAGYSNDDIFVSRVRSAYLRAEVMLTVRKEIAALEAGE